MLTRKNRLPKKKTARRNNMYEWKLYSYVQYSY